MWSEQATKYFLGVYTAFLFLATFFIIPTATSFYYYAWGKHLAWAYFDGPPMIAYFFSLSRALFGNTFFSINCIGFFCFITGAYYVYKTGCLLYNKQTGLISALIWLALPTTTESIFIRVLYDAPLNLFTVLTFYCFSCYLTQKRVKDLYFTALFAGAMILSKYTAAVTLLSILIYLLLAQRALFKCVHLYGAFLVLLGVVSPIVAWNLDHQWISISYLLNFHSQTQNHTSTLNSILRLFSALVVHYLCFMIFTVLGWLNYRKDKKTAKEPNLVLEFIYITLVLEVAFWFVVTLAGGSVRAIYLTPLSINIALMAGYAINQASYGNLFKKLYPLVLIYSIGLIVANSWPIATYLKKGLSYAVVQDALHLPELNRVQQPVAVGYYTHAALLDYFKPASPVYTLPCGDINQYQYWEKPFLNDLSQGKIEKLTYVDFRRGAQCPQQFFNRCDLVASVSHSKVIPLRHQLTRPVSLLVYECSLPKKNAGAGELG